MSNCSPCRRAPILLVGMGPEHSSEAQKPRPRRTQPVAGGRGCDRRSDDRVGAMACSGAFSSPTTDPRAPGPHSGWGSGSPRARGRSSTASRSRSICPAPLRRDDRRGRGRPGADRRALPGVDETGAGLGRSAGRGPRTRRPSGPRAAGHPTGSRPARTGGDHVESARDHAGRRAGSGARHAHRPCPGSAPAASAAAR